MGLRVMRVGAGLLLVASGALMYAASWQRWGGACGWGQVDGARCSPLQDHRYDFVAPSAPWEPVGDAAQLAGWSLLVLAGAYLLLPWALTGRRPGVVAAAALLGSVVAVAAVGLATLRSGLAGSIVPPVASGLTTYVWVLVPTGLLIRFAVDSRGWRPASATFLVLATPFVAAISYAVGPYDAQPWWEAISGALTAVGGLCLLAAALSGTGRSSRPRSRGRSAGWGRARRRRRRWAAAPRHDRDRTRSPSASG